MHITSVEHGYYGSYAIIGAQIPIALGTGVGRARSRARTRSRSCFFGDGTTNIGAFHEAVNLAAVWSLPVVFVCENNHYMEYTPIAEVIPVKRPAADRAAAYGLAPMVVDGNDVDAVRAAVGHAVHRARNGGGPHWSRPRPTGSAGTPWPTPRPTAARRRWRSGSSGPVAAARRVLTAAGVAAEEVEAITARVAAEIERIAVDALAAPPPSRPRRGPTCGATGAPGGGTDLQLTYRQAVAAALAQEMDRDERVVLLGEDIASGGVFKTTLGLLDRFGPAGCATRPISETAIAGAAMGAAMAGLRPVAEIMFSDFYGVCWDQVAVEIAKARYMTGGQFGLPLVIRGANGGGLGFGAQHSQAVENWALCVPGLKIVSPATPADVVGLIAAADPRRRPGAGVRAQGALRDEGRGARRRARAAARAGRGAAGGRATSRWSRCRSTVGMCLAAAERLAEAGISAEVIDLRTLVPLDAAAVLASVRRTGRAVIVEENPGQLGWGAAIAAILAEEAFDDLDGPVLRVTGGNMPLPVAAPLEAEVSVSADRVVAAVSGLLGVEVAAPVS